MSIDCSSNANDDDRKETQTRLDSLSSPLLLFSLSRPTQTKYPKQNDCIPFQLPRKMNNEKKRERTLGIKREGGMGDRENQDHRGQQTRTREKGEKQKQKGQRKKGDGRAKSEPSKGG